MATSKRDRLWVINANNGRILCQVNIKQTIELEIMDVIVAYLEKQATKEKREIVPLAF